MITLALSLMLLAAQAAPAEPASKPSVAPDAPVGTAPPAKAAPEAPPPPPSPRLDGLLAGMKGKPKPAFTAKLGPPTSERQAIDGSVLFWTVRVQGATVCGPTASGGLNCGRQGDAECLVAAAFEPTGGMKVWRATGIAAACEKAADQLEAPTLAVPKGYDKPPKRPAMIPSS